MEHTETEQYRASSLFLISLGIGIVGLLLVVALLNQERDLALLSLLVLALAFGTKAWTRWSLHRVECGLSVDRSRVFPGEELEVTAYAYNRKFLPVWLTLRAVIGAQRPLHEQGSRSHPPQLASLGDPTAQRPLHGDRLAVPGSRSHPPQLASLITEGGAVTAESGLLWHQEARFSWQLAPARRGVYPIGPLYTTAGDLFGFFHRQGGTDATTEVIVYPRLVPLRPFDVKKRDFFGVAGARSPVDDPVYILGTSDYRNGRPAKYIHWKASARHHRLQEKIFEPTQHEKVLLVVDVKDFEEQGDEESFERALEVVASLAVRLDHEGCTLGFATNGRIQGAGTPVIPITRTGQHVSRMLEALARVRMEREQDMVELLRRGVVLPWGVTSLCFVHHVNDAAGRLSQYFRHRRTPVTLFVSQPVAASDLDRLGLTGSLQSLDDIRVDEECGP